MSVPLEMDLHEGPLERRITELEKMVKDLDSRLVYIEEQERSRARADHQREMALDFANSQGLSRAGM